MSSARWLIPILALMSAGNGSRFGAIARSLGMSRSVLSRHLDLLESFGWLVHNPGHGHPLRPEYLLTPPGFLVGTWCERVMTERARLGIAPHDLGRWSLPIMAELRGGWRRFSELERELKPITPRALSLALAQMEKVELVARGIDEQPALYGLTERGRDLATKLRLPR